MKNYLKKSSLQAGFTLVELLLYMGLLSVFLVILSSLFIANLEFQTRTFLNSNLQTSMQFMTTRLVHDIEHADSVSIPTAASESDTQLTLDIDGSTYEYQLSGTTLQLTHNGITEPLHSNDIEVTTFLVTRLNSDLEPPMIQITVTADTTRDSTRQPISISTTVRKL